MTHGLNELVGSSYGRVVAFYRRSRLVDDLYTSLVEEGMKQKTTKSALTAAQKKVLREELGGVPAELRATFETAFNAWKAT